MSKGSEKRSAATGLVPWVVVVGFAAGFLVGRWSGPFGEGSSGPGAGMGDRPSVVAQIAGGGKAYASEAEMPAKYLKSGDLAEVKGVSFAGLSEAQKATAIQALNERKCTCGCGMESLAYCAKHDKACPVSPKLVAGAIAEARQGKSLAQIFAYLDGGKGGAAAPTAPEPASTARKIALPAHAPRKGPKSAKVTVVEFSDFQCPYCSRVNPTLKQIADTYGNDVAIVFVNQPLDFHAQAKGAAQAFLAAHRQGKGWEMHDKMFQNQTALQPPDLERYAQEIGLDVARFKKDAADPAVAKQVDDDQRLANSVGANGTPTFFINGRELSGAQPFPKFKSIIDEELKKADALLAKGVSLDALYDKLSDENVATAPKAPAPAAQAAPAKVDVSVGDAPAKGPATAPVTIVAFSDFECPFCSRVVQTLKQVEEQYKGKVRIAFKHLPLPMHQNAKLAAEASMAAHEQGKFWEMHDKLFENQRALDRASIEGYAQQLGLDMRKFRAALDSGRHRKHVEEDERYAATVGASATPTFYVNGKQLRGAKPFDAFKAEIDAALR